MGRVRASAQLALVGPGSELQLTLDGRAVPHEVVVAERENGQRVGGASPVAGARTRCRSIFPVAAAGKMDREDLSGPRA